MSPSNSHATLAKTTTVRAQPRPTLVAETGAKAAPMLQIRGLNLTYRTKRGSHHAVRDLDLSVARGEFYTLLGPSGCGKSSTMRCLAGLEWPDTGEILIDGQPVFLAERGIRRTAAERRIGMVFQSYAIWPHMTVFGNVAFPLRQQRPVPSAADIRERVMRALETVQLAAFAERPAPFLSGGQQQRLALARAIVAEPRILLLDEPLSNLDAILREDMRLELRTLVERLGITTIFVTHEQIEALSMSDRIGVMREGRLVQEGRPKDVFDAPATRFVANFIGKANLLPARLRRAPDGGVLAETPVGTLLCSGDQGPTEGEATVAIRPDQIELREATDGQNVVPASLISRSFQGDHSDCMFRTGGIELRVRILGTAVRELRPECGLHLPPEACRILRD